MFPKNKPVRLTGDAYTRLRYECFDRDGWKCTVCGETVSLDVPEWHPRRAHAAHIIGRGRGGADVLSNLKTKCNECHMVHEHNPKSVPPKRFESPAKRNWRQIRKNSRLHWKRERNME